MRGVTGADGRWCRGAAPGEYTVRVRHDGLLGAVAPVPIAAEAGKGGA